jgi:hypothetical protein
MRTTRVDGFFRNLARVSLRKFEKRITRTHERKAQLSLSLFFSLKKARAPGKAG